MMWIIFALLSAFFAALVGIFGKMGIVGIDVTLATTVRATIMAIFLVLASLFLGRASLLSTIHSRVLLFMVLSGVAGAISWLFYFNAIKMGPVSGVAALDRLSVVMVLVLAVLFLGESISWKSGIGAILLTAGAVLMTVK